LADERLREMLVEDALGFGVEVRGALADRVRQVLARIRRARQKNAGVAL